MFRITEDPSSGSLVQCLDKNYKKNYKNYKNNSINNSCNFYPSTVQGSLMMGPL